MGQGSGEFHISIRSGRDQICRASPVGKLSVQVAAGTRFGPFLGKWVLEPQREEHAWEVSDKADQCSHWPPISCLVILTILALQRGVKLFGNSPAKQKLSLKIQLS